jgi:hypothetical protein
MDLHGMILGGAVSAFSYPAGTVAAGMASPLRRRSKSKPVARAQRLAGARL